jgi:hypothetical protein
LVVVQPEAGEGARTIEDRARTETSGRADDSAWGSSVTKIAGDRVEAEATVFAQAFVADAATAPEV